MCRGPWPVCLAPRWRTDQILLEWAIVSEPYRAAARQPKEGLDRSSLSRDQVEADATFSGCAVVGDQAL
jgi:hypothetical protein